MTWILIRATGFVAYTFLSGAAIFGLLVATKMLGRSASPKSLTYTHESLSVAAILATIAHMGFLYMDSFIEFTPKELTVLGASDWNPTAVNMGIMAFYGLVIITLSFYVRKRIGQAAWRILHFASFGVFLSAAYHGISAGTDSSTVFAVIIYSSTISLVVGLTITRIVLVRGSDKSSRRPARVAAGTPAAAGASAGSRADAATAAESGARAGTAQGAVGRDKPTDRVVARLRALADPAPEPEPAATSASAAGGGTAAAAPFAGLEPVASGSTGEPTPLAADPFEPPAPRLIEFLTRLDDTQQRRRLSGS
jgi:hypothetical protein